MAGAEPVEFVVAAPGDDQWAEVRGLPLASGMAFILKDVTERERSERQLRQKERRLLATNESLRLAHKAAHAATWEWTAGKSLRWTDLAAARQLIGLPPTWTDDEVIADWRSLAPPEDLPAVNAGLRTLAETGEATFEFRVRGASGADHWLQASGAVVERGPAGEVRRVAGVTLDITAHRAAEQELRSEVLERRRAEEHQQLLIHELNHRVKNTLATVQSVARQSLRGVNAEAAMAEFEERLMALAWTHDILTREHWAGASLTAIVARTLSPYVEPGGERVAIEGPDIRISPKMALALAMGVHELATNAVKYGALSGEAGRVTVRWQVDGSEDPARLNLAWQEQGGPTVGLPEHRGFGSRLLERGLAEELGGTVHMSFEPEGLRCTIIAPLSAEQAARCNPRPAVGERPSFEAQEDRDDHGAPTAH
jgi:two-component sensor histidine kinase